MKELNVSATMTADLRDVCKRLAQSQRFSYWRTYFGVTKGMLYRVFPWIHDFWPRWF